jgi:hypothetical protein
MTTEQLSKLLDSIQGHIRQFDTKAQIALGLGGLVAGLVGSELTKGLELTNWHFDWALRALLITSALSLAAVAASAFYAILTVIPRLHLQQPHSHFFFCHLVEMYGHNYHSAAKSLLALNEDQARHELATQIQTNAVIGNVKAARSNGAMRLMAVSLVLYIITLAPFGLISFRAGAIHKDAAGRIAATATP